MIIGKFNSKTSKKTNTKNNKNECKYKFKQGTKKGTKCNKPCRGNYCKDHNPNKKKYIEQYYKDKKLDNVKEKIEKIKSNKNGKLPSLIKEQIKLKIIEDEIRMINKKIIGIKIVQDPSYEIPINPKYKKEIESKTENDYIDDYKKSLNTDKTISKIREKEYETYVKICGKSEIMTKEEYCKVIPQSLKEFVKEQKELELKHPNNKMHYIPFKGKNGSQMLTTFSNKKKKLKEKLNNQKQFNKELEKIYQEVHKIKNKN
jgi:hypothetical protein